MSDTGDGRTKAPAKKGQYLQLRVCQAAEHKLLVRTLVAVGFDIEEPLFAPCLRQPCDGFGV